MKVVCIDNYVPDRLIEENLTLEAAEAEATALNQRYVGENSASYYVVRPDDYQLKCWEP